MSSASILIVEDEILMALALEEALTDAGFRVVGVYRSGSAALACLRKETVDLVIVDLLLEGGLSGVDFASALRAFWMGPIVFHTAVSNPVIRQRMAQIANATMIFKPTSDADLLRVVRGLLSNKP
jgi:DNA-binding response OmpR family regulator